MWENIHDEKLLSEAHEEILKSTGGNPPPILDPFAGGGSIPLEAQRLGLEAHASDLNPVAVLINKALIEIPPKWAGQAPVFPGAAAERLSWPGATGLAEDVRRYGKWMRDEAEKRIGHLYPKVSISGIDAPSSPGSGHARSRAPIQHARERCHSFRSFWLGKKKGKERYVVPIPDGKRVRFEIGGPDGVPREGTVGRTGAVCLICGTPVPFSTSAKKARPVAWARNSWQSSQRDHANATTSHRLKSTRKQQIVARPDDAPEAELPDQALGFRVQGLRYEYMGRPIHQPPTHGPHHLQRSNPRVPANGFR